MQVVILSKSTRKDKKWQVKFKDGKTIHFGFSGMSDYTLHKDPTRKESYIKRHSKNENWSDPQTAGFWAYHLLWSYPSMQEAINNVEKKFKLKIIKK